MLTSLTKGFCHMMTMADKGGEGGQPIADNHGQMCEWVQTPPPPPKLLERADFYLL